MTTSYKALENLKKAANYSKLALHQNGPHSFVKGQGALLKVLYKFGKKDSLKQKKLKKILRWESQEVSKVIDKAATNGYVVVEGKDNPSVTLTKTGAKVVEKRMKAEDRAADEVLCLLTDDEVDQLYALTQKVIDACQEMGIDYNLIRERPEPNTHSDEWHYEHRHEDRDVPADEEASDDAPIAD